MSKDLTWPGSHLAKLLDLSPRRIQQLTKGGVLKTEARGRYSPRAVADYVRYIRERISDPVPPNEFQEAFDEEGELLGYYRSEPQHFITIDLAVVLTGKSRSVVLQSARSLESYAGPRGTRLYRSHHLLERVMTGERD
jgi:hypothetical protein